MKLKLLLSKLRYEFEQGLEGIMLLLDLFLTWIEILSAYFLEFILDPITQMILVFGVLLCIILWL